MRQQIKATIEAMINQIGELRDSGVPLDAFPPSLRKARFTLWAALGELKEEEMDQAKK